MKNNIKNYILITMGILLFTIGVILVKTINNPDGILKGLPYICIGLGSGILAQGIADIVNNNVLKKHPEIAKQQSIEQNDERNIIIKNRAKAKTYDLMIFILPILLLSTVLVEIDITIVLLSVSAYLGFIAYNIYYFFKYNKEM